MIGLLAPLVSFDAIEGEELNRCLVDWGHRMGPLHRPRFGEVGGAHGLRHNGQLVAVTATEKMIASSTCGLSRSEAVELARVCAIRPDLCRVALRLWREFVLPGFCQMHGFRWAISYQDAAMHSGGLYRFDGWVKLGNTSSGTDHRGREGTRKGRRKVVWGYSPDAALMDQVRG